MGQYTWVVFSSFVEHLDAPLLVFVAARAVERRRQFPRKARASTWPFQALLRPTQHNRCWCACHLLDASWHIRPCVSWSTPDLYGWRIRSRVCWTSEWMNEGYIWCSRTWSVSSKLFRIIWKHTNETETGS